MQTLLIKVGADAVALSGPAATVTDKHTSAIERPAVDGTVYDEGAIRRRLNP